MIKLRLHGIQTLRVEVDRVHQIRKKVFQPIEALLDRGLAVRTSPHAVIVGG